MSEIKVINIFGQFYDRGSECYVVYDKSCLTEQPSLTRYLKDERTLFHKDLRECYALWTSTEGWWISKLVSEHPHDDRGGTAEVAFCLGQNRPSDGRKAIEFLDKAMDFFVTQKPVLSPEKKNTFSKIFWQQEETERWLQDNPLQLIAVENCSGVSNSQVLKKAYRYYSTKEELANILCYLPQSGYEAYSYIFLINKKTGDISSQYDNVTEKIPVRKIYEIKIENPKSTKIDGSTKFVREGEDLHVTFIKEGWNDLRLVTKVQNTACSYIQGDKFIIRDPKATKGLVFTKRIQILIVEKDSTILISDAKVFLNGYKLVSDGGEYYADLKEGEIATLQVEHQGYEPVTQQIRYTEDKYCTVNMVKKQYNLVFKCRSKQYSCNESVGIVDYNLLSKEVGNACVKDEKNRTITINLLRTRQIPGQEGGGTNAGSEGAAGKDKTGSNGKESGADDNGNSRSGKPNFVQKMRRKVKDFDCRYILLFLFLCLVLSALLYLINIEYPNLFGGFTSIRQEQTSGEESSEEENFGQGISQDSSLSDNNEEGRDNIGHYQDSLQLVDIYRLKKEDIWCRDSLQSNKFRVFFDNILDGEIDSISNLEIFKIDSDSIHVNGYWRNIVKRLDSIDNESKRELAISALKGSQSENGSIDVKKLSEEMKKIVHSQSDGKSGQTKQQQPEIATRNGGERPHSH